MKQLPAETRNNITNLLTTGLSSSKIAAQLGINHTSVNRIRKEMTPNTGKAKGDHPILLSTRDKRSLVRWVTSGKVDNSSQLRQELYSTTGNGLQLKICTKIIILLLLLF